MNNEKVILGDALFSAIDENQYLETLYSKLLVSYAKKTFSLPLDSSVLPWNEVRDLLRFADLLSKSNHLEKSEKHRMWAQEIVVLLHFLFPDYSEIKIVAGSVFSQTDNARALDLLQTSFEDPFILNRAFSEYKKEYLRIPAEQNLQFFSAQKRAYDHLNDPYFSYSAPTSMGKSFLMRMFIKEQVQKERKLNFALIVPTKALINEVSQKIIREDLNQLLKQNNYKVVTASSDIALEGNHNFILVLTPERLLYMLIAHPQLHIDYLFIDEAHKLSGTNSRAPFYYKVVDMLNSRSNPPKFIFASPNIPNPDVYLRLLTNIDEEKETSLSTSFSPVSQIKFLLNFIDGELSVYNPYTKETHCFTNISNEKKITLQDFLYVLQYKNLEGNSGQKQQTIIYYNSKNKAVEAAKQLAERFNHLGDSDLDALSRDIASAVHQDYYLTDMIRKGIAYHIGYLPSSIRMRIEELFREGKIRTLFCTSTLLEGVNLPADNLFITHKKIGRANMTLVDFKNLIGRVGRIQYNLFGNVFFVSDEDTNMPQTQYVELLKEPVPEQYLSVEAGAKILKPKERKHIVETLKSGSVEIVQQQDQSESSYAMARKFGLILASDIANDRKSLVRMSFSDLLTPRDEEQIRTDLKEKQLFPDDDINISADQTQNLRNAIREGLCYPEPIDGKFAYKDVMAFLETLCAIFKWEQYESYTLGKVTDGEHKKLRWYGVLLIQWMAGFGLSNIIKKGIEYHKSNPNNFWESRYQVTTYQDTKEFRNVLFGDTLEVIDNIILFSLSNYFLKFSNEFKKIHGVQSFENDWYEYVEYGTRNPTTILLQRVGFSRETATYIRQHAEEFIQNHEGQLKLSRSLLNCTYHDVRNEAANVVLNMPEAFSPNDT